MPSPTDGKFDPVKAGDGKLLTAAEFKDDGVLDERHDHDRSVSGTPDADVIFEREGIGADDKVVDVHDGDPEAKALWNEMVEAVGGPEQVPIAAQDLREALALYPEDREIIEGGGGLTPEENADATLTVISGYREALGNQKKAAAIVADLWAHPHSPVMRAYIHGTDPNVTNAITRLMQAAHGEKPTGRKRPQGGDGHSY